MNGDRLEGEIIKTLTGLKVLIRLHILSGLIYYFKNLKVNGDVAQECFYRNARL